MTVHVYLVKFIFVNVCTFMCALQALDNKAFTTLWFCHNPEKTFWLWTQQVTKCFTFFPVCSFLIINLFLLWWGRVRVAGSLNDACSIKALIQVWMILSSFVLEQKSSWMLFFDPCLLSHGPSKIPQAQRRWLTSGQVNMSLLLYSFK